MLENEESSTLYFYKIEDLIGLKVESDFFTEDSEAIQIKNYTLTRIT